MIEIIREESGKAEKQGLPKDIKQIGKPDIGDRIYVENQVYQFLHPHESPEEKKAYVLLGRFENYGGRDCVFVEAAIWLREIEFEGELPLWNDQTWAYIYKQLKHEYDSMVIVGWALDIKGQLPNMTARLEKLHQSHFGGVHQILFRIDSLEREETFYGTRSGHLYRREGFYIYYKKGAPGVSFDLEAAYSRKEEKPEETEPAAETGIWEDEFFGRDVDAQKETVSKNKKETENIDEYQEKDIIWTHDTGTGTEETDEDSKEEEPDPISSDREDRAKTAGRTDSVKRRPQRMEGKKNAAEGKEGWFTNTDLFGKYAAGRAAAHRSGYRSRSSEQEEHQPVSSYASTFFLLMVVCLLGITAYLNNEKMAAMEETLARMSQMQGGGSDEQEDAGDTEAPEVLIENVSGTVKKQEDQGTAADPAGTADTPDHGAQEPSQGTGSETTDSQNTPAGGQTVTTPPGTTETAGEGQPVQGEPDQQTAQGTPGQQTAQEQQPSDASGQSSETPDQPADPSGTNVSAPAEDAASAQPDAAAAMAEAQTYLSQGYYVVQKGDSLVGICRRIYQTSAMKDKLCEVNGIEDENTIYAGQKLILPN